MASVSFEMKVIDKASKSIKDIGQAADINSKHIEKYEKELYKLNKQQNFYADKIQETKAYITRYEKYLFGEGKKEPKKAIAYMDLLQEKRADLSRYEKEHDKINSRIEQATLNRKIEQQYAKDKGENTKGDQALNKNTKELASLAGGFSLFNFAINNLSKIISNELRENVRANAIATNIKSVSGYDNIDQINKVLNHKYGINKADSMDALNRYSKIADSETQLLQLAKLTDYIATTTNKDYKGVYESIAGALESGNAYGITTQFFGGKRTDNAGLDASLTASAKSGDTAQFIKELYDLANTKGYTQTTYDKMQNTLAKRWQRYTNTFFNKDFETQGEYTSQYLPMSEKLDNLNFDRYPTDTQNAQAINTNRIEQLSTDQVALLTKVAELVKPNNTINIDITNNESQTPPEELAEIVKDKISNEIKSDIEGGINEYY